MGIGKIVIGGDDNYLDIREKLFDGLARLNPIDSWHFYIHQDDIWFGFPGEFYRLSAVFGLSGRTDPIREIPLYNHLPTASFQYLIIYY
jgi:hypothetical protein